MQATGKIIRVIIAGGGTGGHVFPAIAIAKALKKLTPNIEVLFIGALGKMEMQIVPKSGFHIIGLPIAGYQRKSIIKNLFLPFKFLKSIIKAFIIIKRFKPDVVVGVGGYASAPAVIAAYMRKVPILLQEQNSYPGLTNRKLARFADKICVAFSKMEQYFPKNKILITGNPVRAEIKNINEKVEEAINFFKIDTSKKTILVIGGSLGATSINLGISELIDFFKEKQIQLIWQTGKSYYEKARQLVNDKQATNIAVYDFIERMDLAYAAADVIISRAGAIAISELCIVDKPVILIPSPNVVDDHQTKNAKFLVDNNAALLVKDDEITKSLPQAIESIIYNELKQRQLSSEIAKLGFTNADETIANVIISLVKIK